MHSIVCSTLEIIMEAIKLSSYLATSFTDGNDYSEVGESKGFIFFIPNDANTGGRRVCFNISITLDNLSEPTESFTLFLELDPFVVQSGILIQPNVTKVFILDGML